MLIRTIIIVLAFIAARPLPGMPVATLAGAISERVQQIRSGAGLNVEGQAIPSTLVLPTLYERRDYAPVWSNPKAVEQLVQVLKQVDTDGLISDDYHLPAILKLQADDTRGDSATAAGLDILMTDALIRLGYHLLAGKVDAQSLNPHWNMTRTIGDLDTILAMADAIASARIPQLTDSLRPDHPVYERLREGLARYRDIRDRGGWPAVPSGPTLKPGMIDARVAPVRRRLAVTGELAAQDSGSQEYDTSLQAAVKRFQRNHNLTPDAILGPATLAEMNVPVQTRINQIKVNLERARWVLHHLPEDVVITDIAGFEVSYRRGGKIIWSTKAQVGTPYRKTPVFKDRIRYLEINPTWTVPPTILRNDILPKLAVDPDYLRQKDMQVLTHNGKPVDPATVDWSLYPQKPFPYLLRQNPGPRNALGRIKFMFPNKFAVYLHDTPSRSLFERDQRAFSSGCIRIQHPFELAELLLDDPQWTRKRLDDIVASKKTTRVNLADPVSILLMYWTVNAEPDGVLLFKHDIYDRDSAVLAGLNEPFRFRDAPILDEQVKR